jgi:predicted transcriptional regulator
MINQFIEFVESAQEPIREIVEQMAQEKVEETEGGSND